MTAKVKRDERVKRVCPQCGIEVDARADVCPECGGPVKLVKVEESQTPSDTEPLR